MEDYNTKIGTYITELHSSDMEGKFELLIEGLGVNEQPIFRRFYICFSVLRKGYQEYSLKIQIGGALLTTVAI